MRINRFVITVFVLLLAALAAVAAPKNIILMIGDGMGTDIVAAAGAYRFGAAHRAFGGDKRLTLETLARHYLVTTFSTDGKGYDCAWAGGSREYPKGGATDSAAAGTAMACGVKTYNGAIDMDKVGRKLPNITEVAQQAGLKTGVVTSVLFYDATPACFAAHNAGRGNAKPITHEMLLGVQPDVLMGAGNPNSFKDNPYAAISEADWAAITGGKTPYALAQTRAEFRAAIEKPAAKKLLGLFTGGVALAPRNADGNSANPDQPTLAEMTQAALTTLGNSAGFVLMVEGGAIDKHAHPNKLDAVIGETLAFDDAVAAVLAWIATHGGWEENLLIITADHDTGYLNSVKPTAAGTLPTGAWGTTGAWGGHTNRLVDLYAQGIGSDRFEGYALRTKDVQHGDVAIVDNTTIFQVMQALVPGKQP
jgi:alkaline phosphatase